MSQEATSFPKSKIKILLLESVHPGVEATLREAGYTNIETHPRSLPEDRLKEALRDTHLIGIRSRTQLTSGALAEARKLYAVGCFCIGTDQVDLDAAQDLGIPVFNAPFSNTRSVAELVIAEVVLLLRKIPERNAKAHRGVWAKSAEGAHEARGRTLGIVGYGHIGTQVGLLAEAFGMRVLFHDIQSKLALGNAEAASSLDQVLASSDVVTLHVPETPLTATMIGERELARMKPGAALINASRGSVVDIDALAAALDSGQLSGAAVDVYPQEPKSNEEPFESPLSRFENVLLTPHIGGSTLEAQASIGQEVAGKLLTFSDNGSTVSSVNFPEVNLPTHEGRHRILHIHRNQPGVLAQIHEFFSSHAVNVTAEYLQTTERIGYVVIDIEARSREETRAFKQSLDAVDATIRCRLLY